MQHPNTGVPLRDQKFLLSTFPSCMVMNEAIDWLVNHGKLFSRPEATKLFQKLIDMQIVQNCAKGQPIADKISFYEFVVWRG